MFGKFAEQLQQSSQPLSAMVAVNTKAFEAVSKQQAAFVSGMLSDSATYFSHAAKQPCIKGVIAAQTTFSESVRDRFTTATSGTLSVLSEARDDLSKLLSQSITTKPSEVSKTEQVSPSKATSATKPQSAVKTPVAAQQTQATANPTAKSSVAKPETKSPSKATGKPAVKKSAVGTKKAPTSKASTKRSSSTAAKKRTGAAAK